MHPYRTLRPKQNCTKGKYSASPGNSECEDCAEGYFADTAGMVSCDKCNSEEDYGQQYTSPEGSATCSQCIKTSIMINNECEHKGDGVNKDKKGSTLHTLELEEGYYRFTGTSREVYECTR